MKATLAQAAQGESGASVAAACITGSVPCGTLSSGDAVVPDLIAAVATATWDASGSEPAGSLTLTFDLTFAAE
ncbi:MAG: hypothetical protein ABJE95_04965 [Byssovorax sp.]